MFRSHVYRLTVLHEMCAYSTIRAVWCVCITTFSLLRNMQVLMQFYGYSCIQFYVVVVLRSIFLWLAYSEHLLVQTGARLTYHQIQVSRTCVKKVWIEVGQACTGHCYSIHVLNNCFISHLYIFVNPRAKNFLWNLIWCIHVYWAVQYHTWLSVGF